MPWDGRIVAWELGRPALYVCRTALILAESNAPSRDEFPPFRFGCREVWREGREIMMNGHKAHFRPTFTFKSRKWGLKYLQDIGYNVGFWGHSVDGAGFSDLQRYDAHDELGMGMYASMGAQNTIGAGAFHRDDALRREFERIIRVQHRLTRNHPALLAGIVSQMTICETGTRPDRLGQYKATGDRVAQIELACELHRRYNPNILYFSHADGTCGDMASANLYLNFTPLQEREEWLCCWATNGILPWCSIEFGQPYNGNFWKQGVFLPTEFLAMFYGERAYAEEPPQTLARMVGSTRWRHHEQMMGDSLYKGLPLYWDLRRKWTRRSSSVMRSNSFFL
jgi:beta-galactosidase